MILEYTMGVCMENGSKLTKIHKQNDNIVNTRFDLKDQLTHFITTAIQQWLSKIKVTILLATN